MDFHQAEDTDYLLRVFESGARFEQTNTLCLYYRRHEHNMTRDTTTARRSFAAAIFKSMRRRKAKIGVSFTKPQFDVQALSEVGVLLMTDYGVVIPAFNAERTLRETLESVLAQTVAAAEIVVVDDGSTDGTADLAASVSPRVRVVRQANAGPGAATSRGIHELRSPLVATVDADDIWLPTKMKIQLQALAADREIALISAKMRQFHHGQIDDHLGEIRSGPTRSTIVVRREVFFAVGDLNRSARPFGRVNRLAGAGYEARDIACTRSMRCSRCGVSFPEASRSAAPSGTERAFW